MLSKKEWRNVEETDAEGFRVFSNRMAKWTTPPEQRVCRRCENQPAGPPPQAILL